MTVIKIKNSNVAGRVPAAGDLEVAELGINLQDKKLYSKDAAGSIFEIGAAGDLPSGSIPPNSGNNVGDLFYNTKAGEEGLYYWDGSSWILVSSEPADGEGYVKVSGDTMTGALILPSGTAAAPALGVGSTDNGVYSPDADQVAISTNGFERLRITSAGLIGIGTSDPLAELHLNDTTGVSRLRFTGGAAFADNFEIGQSIVGDSNSGFSIYDVDEAATRFVIDSSGRVGIGTTSPGVALHVDGDIRADGIYGETDTNTSIQFPGSDVITFNEGGSEAARIDSSGRLLVGTSSDSGGALLQVNGDRIRVATAKTPASASDTGTTGEICWDASYIYVCTATNTWKRAALSTW